MIEHVIKFDIVNASIMLLVTSIACSLVWLMKQYRKIMMIKEIKKINKITKSLRYE